MNGSICWGGQRDNMGKHVTDDDWPHSFERDQCVPIRHGVAGNPSVRR